jgi:hypothetical protein
MTSLATAMESLAVGPFTAVSVVNPPHSGVRFSLLFRKFNLHDVKISRVTVNVHDERNVLTLVAAASIESIVELSGRRGCRGFQPIFHLLVPHQSRLLHHRTALVEDNEIRDAAHVEPGSNLRVAFGVEFYHYSSSRHISSGTRNFGCCHPARSAP